MYGVTTKSGSCQRTTQAVSGSPTPASPSLLPDSPWPHGGTSLCCQLQLCIRDYMAAKGCRTSPGFHGR